MEKNFESKIEPYRVLFPIGAFLSVIGVLFWSGFQFRWIHFYPRLAHGNLMFFGFLWSFVAGFLMTAVPKMTGTRLANIIEISIAAIFSFLQIILCLRNLNNESLFLALIQNLYLIGFLGLRFYANPKIPFSGFIFIPFAFIISFIGFSLAIFRNDFSRDILFLLVGEAFLINLICGLGSRLVPVISRLPQSLSPLEQSKSLQWKRPFLFALVLNFGFILQALGYESIGYFLKMGALFGIYIFSLKFFKKPQVWSVIGAGLKISLLLLLLGEILNYSFFQVGLAALHLVYIGGFALVTFLIATRVILAHGQQDLVYEVKSKRILFFIGLFVLASMARFISNKSVDSHWLLLAVFSFTIAVGLWLHKFMKIYN